MEREGGGRNTCHKQGEDRRRGKRSWWSYEGVLALMFGRVEGAARKNTNCCCGWLVVEKGSVRARDSWHDVDVGMLRHQGFICKKGH